MIADLVKVVVGALIAIVLKEAFEHWHAKIKDRQTRWLPFLRAAQELRKRLLELVPHYLSPGSRWNGHWWKDSDHVWRPLPMEAQDIHELYLLDAYADRIENFNEQPIDPGQRRQDAGAVQRVKARVHELNRITAALYATAAYLGYAQKMRRELPHGRLLVHPDTQREIIALLDQVRDGLNGPSGAGFVNDLQDLLGEAMWEKEDVIGYHAFRERIFTVVGWEQFNELFRFFLHFHYKIGHEVQATVDALGTLCAALEALTRPGWHRYSVRDWLIGGRRAAGTWPT